MIINLSLSHPQTPLHEGLRRGTDYLKEQKVLEPEISAEQLLCFVLQKSRIELLLNPNEMIGSEEMARFQSLLSKRAGHYPLQYLTGSVSFRGHELEVGEGCLIPRPETELLVDWALELSGREHEALHVLDIGTGSGNIAVSLGLERPEWTIVGTDISPEALHHARKNANKHRVFDRVLLVECDVWDNSYLFDVVVSNPPYLSQQDFLNLQKEVGFEPRIALDGGKDGLIFYQRIISESRNILKPGGLLFFEIGLGQAGAISTLLKKHQFESIRIKKDDAGMERFISGVLRRG